MIWIWLIRKKTIDAKPKFTYMNDMLCEYQNRTEFFYFLLYLHHHHHHYWADIIMFLYCAAIEQTNYSFIHSFSNLIVHFVLLLHFDVLKIFLHTEPKQFKSNRHTNKQFSLCILSAYVSLFFFISSFIALFSTILRTFWWQYRFFLI